MLQGRARLELTSGLNRRVNAPICFHATSNRIRHSATGIAFMNRHVKEALGLGKWKLLCQWKVKACGNMVALNDAVSTPKVM
jgi:hypothetical protein